jgi:hypothetical protein
MTEGDEQSVVIPERIAQKTSQRKDSDNEGLDQPTDAPAKQENGPCKVRTTIFEGKRFHWLRRLKGWTHVRGYTERFL